MVGPLEATPAPCRLPDRPLWQPRRQSRFSAGAAGPYLGAAEPFISSF